MKFLIIVISFTDSVYRVRSGFPTSVLLKMNYYWNEMLCHWVWIPKFLKDYSAFNIRVKQSSRRNYKTHHILLKGWELHTQWHSVTYQETQINAVPCYAVFCNIQVVCCMNWCCFTNWRNLHENFAANKHILFSVFILFLKLQIRMTGQCLLQIVTTQCNVQ